LQNYRDTLAKVRYLILIFLLVFPSITLANSIINDAMNSYKEKKYDKATKILLSRIDNYNGLEVVEKLKIGLIFSKSLKFYQDVYTKTKKSQLTYLTTLVKDDVKQKSLYANFYLAEILILENQLTKAKQRLNEFSAKLTPNNEYYQLAEIYLAWIAYLNNNKKQYNAIIKNIDRTNVILNMAIHHLEISLSGMSKVDIQRIKRLESKLFPPETLLTSRFSNYALRIAVNQNDLKYARHILNRTNMGKPSHIEKFDSSKLLRFYEVTQIDSVAEFYYKQSKSLLTAASKDAKYHDLATFHLSELDLVRVNSTSAKTYLKAVENLRRLPKSISSLTTIRSTTHGYLVGQRSRAFQAWQDGVNNFKNDPIQSADAVLMCVYLRANCPQIVQTAQLSAENGRSKRFEALNTNVGRYFLLKSHNKKALRLLENAMDRSNTNSLLANEPILLLNYAEALRLNKNFSESLQIFFSLGENFPIMRQLQDAVQGEYLFRQRSSGAINIF